MTITWDWLSVQLEGVSPLRPSGWCDARCPAHADTKPSLGIWVDHRDRHVRTLKCGAGCPKEAILAAFGLPADALKRTATWKKKDGPERTIEDHYDYHRLDGTLAFQVLRFTNPKEFRQRRPKVANPKTEKSSDWVYTNVKDVSAGIIYRWPDLAGHSTVVIVEGEKDVNTCWERDLPATTCAEGAGKWTHEHTQALLQVGIKAVYLSPDNDPAGAKHVAHVAAACLEHGLAVKMLSLPGLPPKGDITDWFAAGQTRADLDLLVQQTPWTTAEDVAALLASAPDPAAALDPRLVEPLQAIDRLSEYPANDLLLAPLDAAAAILVSIADPTARELAFRETYLRLRIKKIKDDEARKLLKAAMAKARSASGAPLNLDPAQLEKARAEAREQATAVLYATDPLDEISKELRRIGWGGDVKPLQVLYLNMTTRVLPRRRGTLTGHTQVNGAPGSGKSFGLECVLALLPHDAFELYDAGSQKVMIYDPVSYKHKVIVYREADSLPGVARGEDDNPAASMLRTLLQEGEASYKVPIKDKESGTFVIQEIRKEGPTVLAVTVVDRLRGQQLDSRLFALDIPEEHVQKQRALDAQAEAELQGDYPEPNPTVLAFQRFLQLSAPTPAVVPFVRAFNTLLGTSRVDARLLRDAARILSLIKAVTIVRQAKRERDEHGRLVATFEDYQTVADLLLDVYENTVTGCSPKMRELVEHVATVGSISITKLAEMLGISKPAAHKRVKIALANGWLLNLEHRSGFPAHLKVGDSLPHPAGLPSVEQLRAWKPVRTPVQG
jgi:hypothetical protein